MTYANDRISLSRLPIGVLIAAFAATAHGASQRTFVASYGVDASNLTCSLANPCRSFNAAIGNTNAGGEVVVLDTAAYGAMSITKAIKIIGPSGVYGGISVFAGDGVNINAGDSDVVTLRGLDVTGLGGLYGVNIVNAKVVHIEKSTISGFANPSGACLHVDSAKNIRVFVDDSFLRDCQNGAVVNGSSAAGRPRLLLDNTRIERGTGNNTDVGVWATGNADIGIRNSVLTSLGYSVRLENALAGASPHMTIVDTEMLGVTNPAIFANSGSGTQMQVEIDRSHFKAASLDISATNNSRAVVFVDQSTFSSNQTAIRTSGTGGSSLHLGLTRSKINTSTTAIDHGYGQVVLNASDVVWNTNSLVNNGSGDIKSLNNNLITANADSTGGVIYITPAIIPTR